MMKSRITAITLILIAIVMTISGCAGAKTEISQTASPTPAVTQTPETDVPEETIEEVFTGILEERLSALEEKDYDAYMSRIGRNNQFYFNEQERWFMNMTDERISRIQYELLSVDLEDEDTAIVNIRQKHFMGKLFNFSYALKFIKEDGKWMDYGFNFLESKNDRFTVKYMEDETRLDEFTGMLNDAFDHLEQVYELKPLDDYEMKLFTSQEMLRQRSVPANLWLFTGWSEPDESMKLYTGHNIGYEPYAGVVQHELVHHITIRMCNNNLPMWILEGIAMYDGSAYYGVKGSSMLARIEKESVSFTIENLENNDLNTDLTEQEIVNFYNTSYMYVRYIDEVYGRDKLMELFSEAGKKPFHDSTLNLEFETNNQKTADDVLMTVLGLTKTDLSREYLNWLDEFDFDSMWEQETDVEEVEPESNLKAMILLGNEFGNSYFDMKDELEALGFEVVTVGAGSLKVLDSCPNHTNKPVVPDMNISDIDESNITEYCALYIPAGKHHRTLPFTNGVDDFLNLCYENSICISSMCAGSLVLASVDGLIEGYALASNSSSKSGITNAGANAKSTEIVVDGLFVTSSASYKSSGTAAVRRLAEKIYETVVVEQS